MASLSSSQPPQRSFGGGPSGQDTNAPLSTLSFGFIRTLTEKRTTRDGQPQKRRGPKPDSKPALTRRQELNRQAQRTHRERKELYIKALEDEVLRLKAIFSNVSQDKERLAEENRQLRALLAQNGLGGVGSSTGGGSVPDDSTSNPSAGYSPGTSYVQASSNTSAFATPPQSASSGSRGAAGGRGISPHSATYSHQHQHPHHTPSRQEHWPGQSAGAGVGSQPRQNPNLDYEQAGIDFVLTLEKPCMSHLPWMLERSTSTGGNEPCGHALMASCPPEPFSQLSPDIPFGDNSQRHGHTGHHHHHAKSSANANHDPNRTGSTDSGGRAGGTWELTKGDLATLLDLSKRLNLDGEITPVMAWGMVLAHPRLGELRAEDFVRLTEELSGKVRCYGFGAVMEEFEVRDALESIFSTKTEFGTGY